MTRGELDEKLLTNVIDLRFVRKRQVKTKGPTRRMLCTKSYELLGSVNGKSTLNYRPPASAPSYNLVEKNIVVVWDIFMQDYRTINADGVEILKVIPANEEFWKYFNSELRLMGAKEKMAFIRS